MAEQIVVEGASASLTASPPLSIVTSSHTLSISVSGPFAKSDGSEMLLEEDIDASFATYTTPYNNPPYVGGTLMYQSLKSISNLSELTKKDGEAVAIKTTEGTITCAVLVPAPDPTPGPPDTTPSYDLDFTISDAGQTLSSSD